MPKKNQISTATAITTLATIPFAIATSSALFSPSNSQQSKRGIKRGHEESSSLESESSSDDSDPDSIINSSNEDWVAQRLDASSEDELSDQEDIPYFHFDTFMSQWKTFSKDDTFFCTKSFYSLMCHYFGKKLFQYPNIQQTYLKKIKENSLETEESFDDLRNRILQIIIQKLTSKYPNLPCSLNLNKGVDQFLFSEEIDRFLLKFLTRDHLKFIQNATSTLNKFAVELYLYVKPFLPKSESQKNFVSFFKATLQNTIASSLYRPTLPKGATLIIQSQLDFFAALRLFLRSSKNMQRNLQDIQYHDKADVLIPFNMEFSGHLVSGRASFSHGQEHKRNQADLVLHFGSYAEDIINRLKYFGINDGDRAYHFADDIRQIMYFPGSAEEVKWSDRITFDDPRKNGLYMEFCHELVYFLFGCETIRNPAAFIHHMMALDLLEAGASYEDTLVFKSWGDAFQAIPMSIPGACKAANFLHKTYGPFLNLPYRYPGDVLSVTRRNPPTEAEVLVNQLIEREQALVERWFKYVRAQTDYDPDYEPASNATESDTDQDSDYEPASNVTESDSDYSSTSEDKSDATSESSNDPFVYSLKETPENVFNMIQQAIEKRWYKYIFNPKLKYYATPISAFVWTPAHYKRLMEITSLCNVAITTWSVSNKFKPSDSVSTLEKYYGLTLLPVEGDGNCFFHTVAAVDFIKKDHLELRALTTNYIIENIDEMSDFFEMERDEFIDKLSKPGEWVGEVAIHALAQALKLNLTIIHQDGSSPNFIREGGQDNEYIRLLYNGIHYDLLQGEPVIELLALERDNIMSPNFKDENDVEIEKNPAVNFSP